MTPIRNEIFSSYDNLYEAEQKVADFILNNWEDTMDSTIIELAKLIGVSEATIIRFCKKIGLKGFHQLKIQMAKESFISEINIEKDYDGNINLESMSRSIENIKRSKVEEITETFNNIKSEEMKDIIELVLKSKTVLFSAVGNTIPIALDGSYKFNQLGIRSFTATVWESQMAFAKGLGKKDILIAISDSGESKNIISIAKIAKKAGAKIIAITGKKNSSLSEFSDYVIETFSREQIFHNWISFTRVSAMSIIDFMFLMLLNSDKLYLNRVTEHEENISDNKV